MQQATESAPSPTTNSFASLLASMAAPKPSTAWNDDDLADDVATLSYENALRTHVRYRSLDSTDRSFTQSAGANVGRVDSYELASVEEAPKAEPARPFAASQSAATAGSEATRPASTPLERNLKSASITIRMSREESAQLHRRAAEAGLTVSAYLRSCTFEAESLRALVKDTMAQLRVATSARKHAAPPRSLGQWLRRLFKQWRTGTGLARA